MAQLILNGNIVNSTDWLQSNKQRGFTYIGVLVIMAVMLTAMGAASEVWHVVMQQEKEQELIFVGHQFRTAIAKYYKQSGSKYPPTLEALVESNDASGKKVHYLRKLYVDPVTGNDQWGLILGNGAGLAGIYSISGEKPYKTAGFSDADSSFEGAEKYSDWKFVYIPTVARVQAGTGTGVGTVVNGLVRPVPRAK
jgi:type II secretory pathway pseudopilin PulG